MNDLAINPQAHRNYCDETWYEDSSENKAKGPLYF